MISNHNPTALVTGGAKRIGASIVKFLAEQSYNVIFTYKNSHSEAKRLLKDISSTTSLHVSVKLSLEKRIPEDFFLKIGPVHLLINNASLYLPESLLEESQDQIVTQIHTNFIAPLILSKLFAQQNIKSGLIINILDCRIATLERAHGSYWLSKKSLQNATEMLAALLAPRIRVNAIAPGAILPPSSKPNFSLKNAADAAPLKKIPPIKQILNAISFLIQNDSITGQTIFIDSGRHLINAKKTKDYQ